MLNKVIRYHCVFCNKDFRTPNRHDCKRNPCKKNCFSCVNLKGWHEPYEVDTIDVGMGRGIPIYEIYPDCLAYGDQCEECLEGIKNNNYNMQCGKYEFGDYWKDYWKDYAPEMPF